MVGQPLAPLVAGVTGLWGVCLKSLGATLGTGYQAVWVLVGWSTAKGLFRYALHFGCGFDVAVHLLHAFSFSVRHRLATELALEGW